MLIGAALALIAVMKNTSSATARPRMAMEFIAAMLSGAARTSRLRLPAPGLDAKNRRIHTMKKFIFALVALAISAVAAVAASAARPNFIYVLCDDLGYGDVKCLNSDGKIATPNVAPLA